MRRATEMDKIFNDHPYADYIPNVIVNGNGRRACRDTIEANFQWGLFSGTFIGYALGRIRYA